jgi:hypothetical protein
VDGGEARRAEFHMCAPCVHVTVTLRCFYGGINMTNLMTVTGIDSAQILHHCSSREVRI